MSCVQTSVNQPRLQDNRNTETEEFLVLVLVSFNSAKFVIWKIICKLTVFQFFLGKSFSIDKRYDTC